MRKKEPANVACLWLLGYYLSVHERVQSAAVIENACLIKDMCESLTWAHNAGVEQSTYFTLFRKTRSYGMNSRIIICPCDRCARLYC